MYAFAGAILRSKGTQGSAEAPHALGSLSTILTGRALYTKQENKMKKFLVASLMVLAALPALAQHGHHGHYGHRHHGHGGGWSWIAPALIGGAVVYAATRPPVVVQQPPVVVQQQPAVVYIDGVAYTKQWVQINGQWQEVLVRM